MAATDNNDGIEKQLRILSIGIIISTDIKSRTSSFLPLAFRSAGCDPDRMLFFLALFSWQIDYGRCVSARLTGVVSSVEWGKSWDRTNITYCCISGVPVRPIFGRHRCFSIRFCTSRVALPYQRERLSWYFTNKLENGHFGNFIHQDSQFLSN